MTNQAATGTQATVDKWPGPLSGLRVLDLCHYGVGPWACVQLGEMGADVIKVEPLEGDHISKSPPPYKNGITTVYICSNVNKRIAQVDFHDELVRETMYQLVRTADIVVENHRPGYYERRGLGYEAVSKINPRVIYCSSSGYGSRGPYREMGSADTYGQAISGFASVNGGIGQIPEGMKGTSPADHGASQCITSGILAALYAREVTGRGQFVDTSQMHAMIGMSTPRAAEYFASGEVPKPMGSGVQNIVPTRAFKASDGPYVNISALDEPTWQRLCAALGLTDLARDSRLQSNAGRVAHRAEVDGAIEAVVATQPAEHWALLLQGAQVPAGLYFTFNNLRVNDQVRQLKMIEDVNTVYGRVTIGGMPWHFSRTPGAIRPTHRPGSDTEEIRTLFAPGDAPPPAPVNTDTGVQLAKGPLEGLRVIDITEGYVGFCGMTMGDMGATVIKVEPPEGDYLRKHGPPFVGDDAAAFLGVNRSKQSVALAWKTDAKARADFDRLLADADVLISDLQPSAARELKVNYDSLAAGHPRLVLCSITPFGEAGPMGDQPATDLEIQGISAQWRWLGEWAPNMEPVRMGIPIGPVYAAIFAFHGTMAALYERSRSGRGQQVAVSQLGAQTAMQSTMWTSESEPDEWMGHVLLHQGPPARGFATGTVPILWGFRSGVEALRTFCERLGIGDLMDQYNPRDNRWVQNKKAIFEEAFKTHTADELIGWVRELGGDAVHYHTFDSLTRDPQVVALGLMSEYDYPGVGRISTTGLSWEFSDTPVQHGRPPLLGEHTREVLDGPKRG